MKKMQKLKIFTTFKNNIIFIVGLIFLIIIDLMSKNIIFESKFAGYYIMPILNFLKVKNYGISFGLFNEYPNVTIYFIITINIFIIFYLLFCLKTKNKYKYPSFFTFSICTILSGAFGNLFDRIYYGYVRDFIDFHINEYHWPCFNLADVYICVGVVIFAMCEFVLKNK